jgi:hypothetical protein
MLRQKTAFTVGLLVLFVLALAGFRQFNRRTPASPPATATCRFADGKTITVEYSSPRVRGRTIFGGLVPYGDVWILGANEATSFVPTTNVAVGGKSVPAGSYSMFAIPEPDAWTLIVNKTKREDIGRMSRYPGQGSDLVRIPMTASKLPSKVENFTISFVQNGGSCAMHFDWDTTRASIAVQEEQ